MKTLIFNHHPDHLWYSKNLFENLGISVDIASAKLAFELGADYYSVSDDNKFRSGLKYFDPNELFPNENFNFSNSCEGYDYYLTLNPQIANNLPFNRDKVIFATVFWGHLVSQNNFNKYKKFTSISQAPAFGAHRITYYVPQRGFIKEKKYVTQLMEGYKSIYFNDLIDLRNNGIPTIIAGHPDAPDKIVNDWEYLQQSTLAVHDKPMGSCCNAVMKALDCGVPVYISKNMKFMLGFEDVPDFCFIFSDDFSLKDAYILSKNIDNKNIQNTFRSIKNKDKAIIEFKNLLESP